MMTTALLAPANDTAEEDLDDFAIEIPATAHTLAGFRNWILSDDVPEKRRISFLQGRIIVDMGKEEILTHAAVKTAVAGTMFQLIETLDFGDLYINGVLLTNKEADVSNNPDMMAIRWQTVEEGKVRYVESSKNREVEIEGSPDWVLEIVSRSSALKDKRDLRNAYHQAGIREYWLIDARGEEIEFHILHWRKAGYVAAPSKEGWQRSKVFPCSFQLTRKRDRRGGWRYQLATKTP
ncbi:MAG: Uma2 family endonuclease [Planctomycetota bacterium]